MGYMRQIQIRKHFDTIAKTYDSYKKDKPYYLGAILYSLNKVIKPKSNIFDYGGGTGNILSALPFKIGVGYDISEGMIKVAKRKFGHLQGIKFSNSLPSQKPFDYILLVDVIEHLASVEKTCRELKPYCNKNTVIIISYVDSIWEPVLWIMEKMGLKMPEGPHKRISINKLVKIFQTEGYVLTKRESIPLNKWLPISPITFLYFKDQVLR